MNQEDYQKELIKLKTDPHNYITRYYEELYPKMGGRVMNVLSLVPCSLVLPPFNDKNGKKTAIRINYLLLSKPGTAKTTLSEHFTKLALNSFPFEYITDSKLSSFLDEKTIATIIVSDISRIFRDLFLSKQLENILGEEAKLSRFTQKSKKTEEKKIDAVAYLSGTPSNINTTISDGIIFRVHPDIIEHTQEEHDEILRIINDRIGNGDNNQFMDKEEVIIDFYKKLYSIQEGTGELQKITHYEIPDRFREYVRQKIIPELSKAFKDTESEYVRELNQCYKYVVSIAFLNIYNRKIENGKLFLAEEDLQLAIRISLDEIKTKVSIIHCIKIYSDNNFRVIQDLNNWIGRNPEKITKFEYQILKQMILNR